MNGPSTELFTRSLGKILTVMVGGREFGIQILDTKEVIGFMQIEPIPQTPEFMLGMINLRGAIIPVIDLRLKLGVKATARSAENCIVIVETNGRLTGALVDNLVGVVTLEPSQYQDHPDLGENLQIDYFQGVGILGERLITLLDMKRVLSNQELAEMERLQAELV